MEQTTKRSCQNLWSSVNTLYVACCCAVQKTGSKNLVLGQFFIFKYCICAKLRKKATACSFMINRHVWESCQLSHVMINKKLIWGQQIVLKVKVYFPCLERSSKGFKRTAVSEWMPFIVDFSLFMTPFTQNIILQRNHYWKKHYSVFDLVWLFLSCRAMFWHFKIHFIVISEKLYEA